MFVKKIPVHGKGIRGSDGSGMWIESHTPHRVSRASARATHARLSHVTTRQVEVWGCVSVGVAHIHARRAALYVYGYCTRATRRGFILIIFYQTRKYTLRSGFTTRVSTRYYYIIFERDHTHLTVYPFQIELLYVL